MLREKKKSPQKLDQYCVLLRLLHPVLVSLKCDNLPLSKLPLTAEVFSVFAKAGTDKALSDEAAFFLSYFNI